MQSVWKHLVTYLGQKKNEYAKNLVEAMLNCDESVLFSVLSIDEAVIIAGLQALAKQNITLSNKKK